MLVKSALMILFVFFFSRSSRALNIFLSVNIHNSNEPFTVYLLSNECHDIIEMYMENVK